jgi:probable HAF family extracellular repeat protein
VTRILPAFFVLMLPLGLARADLFDETWASGINHQGQIVGYFLDTTGREHGFLKDGHTYNQIDVPFTAAYTQAFGINNNGQIVGYFNAAGSYGYLKDGSSFTSTSNSDSIIWGINNSGSVAGAYGDSLGFHGFVSTGFTLTSLDFPGAAYTMAIGINDSGLVLGRYGADIGMSSAFLWNGSTYSTLHLPGTPFGINNSGWIVGAYGDHGFVWDGSSFSTLDVPGADFTVARGINNLGEVVGNYGDRAGFHGFVWDGSSFSTLDVPGAGFISPGPEPSTLAIAGLSGALLLVYAWRRKSLFQFRG